MVADHLSADAGRALTGMYLGLLIQKCALIARQNESERETIVSATDLVTQFKTLVDKHFREQHAVQHYAELLDISPDYLSKSVKKILWRNSE